MMFHLEPITFLLLVVACAALSTSTVTGFSFVVQTKGQIRLHAFTKNESLSRMQQYSSSSLSSLSTSSSSSSSSLTSLRLVDSNIIMGGGIAVAGLAAGIGLVAFTEQQGERARQRGGGLSESMSTQLTGKLMEDVEVSSVEDLGSLTSQLEKALKSSGGLKDDSLIELTEEDKKRIQEAADDGW